MVSTRLSTGLLASSLEHSRLSSGILQRLTDVVGYLGGDETDGFLNAWDILGFGATYPKMLSGADFTDSTSQFDGKCFARGSINFAMFGWANRLCSHSMGGPSYSLAATLTYIQAYKAFNFFSPHRVGLDPLGGHAFNFKHRHLDDTGTHGIFDPDGSEYDARCGNGVPKTSSIDWRWAPLQWPDGL